MYEFELDLEVIPKPHLEVDSEIHTSRPSPTLVVEIVRGPVLDLDTENNFGHTLLVSHIGNGISLPPHLEPRRDFDSEFQPEHAQGPDLDIEVETLAYRPFASLDIETVRDPAFDLDVEASLNQPLPVSARGKVMLYLPPDFDPEFEHPRIHVLDPEPEHPDGPDFVMDFEVQTYRPFVVPNTENIHDPALDLDMEI